MEVFNQFVLNSSNLFLLVVGICVVPALLIAISIKVLNVFLEMVTGGKVRL